MKPLSRHAPALGAWKPSPVTPPSYPPFPLLLPNLSPPQTASPPYPPLPPPSPFLPHPTFSKFLFSRFRTGGWAWLHTPLLLRLSSLPPSYPLLPTPTPSYPLLPPPSPLPSPPFPVQNSAKRFERGCAPLLTRTLLCSTRTWLAGARRRCLRSFGACFAKNLCVSIDARCTPLAFASSHIARIRAWPYMRCTHAAMLSGEVLSGK